METIKNIFYTPKLLSRFIFIYLFLHLHYSVAQDSYTVTVEDVTERLVHINATLFPQKDTLIMTPYGATHLKDGWATFIQNLKATDQNGEKLELKKLDNGVFIIPKGNTGKPVYLDYSVTILHDRGNWPFGYKEAAYVNDEMLMTTGNALFITRLDMDSAKVHFQLKKSYKIANAWQEISRTSFLVKGAEELLWTAIALGNFNLEEIKAGNANILLAFGNDLTSEKDRIVHTITEAVKKYHAYYGGYPAIKQASSAKTVYIMNVDSTYVGGGATFVNSISILLNSKPSIIHQAKTTSWHHILIHEIGHLWNGHTLKSDEKTEWFKEGFTDFVAYRIAFEMGFFDEIQWDLLVAEKHREYEQAMKMKRVSLENAGSDKGGNYDIIYSGGFLFALKLDIEIKKATNDQKGMEDFLKNVYVSFGNTDKIITTNDLKLIAENTCDCTLDTLFSEVLTD